MNSYPGTADVEECVLLLAYVNPFEILWYTFVIFFKQLTENNEAFFLGENNIAHTY